MSKSCALQAVLGVALMLAPMAATAQTPAAQPAEAQAATAETPAEIPPDQQVTKEQLAKLFEVMQIRKQAQAMLKAIPAMVQQQIRSQSKEMSAKLGSPSLPPEEQAAIEKITDKYMEQAFSIMNVDEMLDDLAVVYPHHLTRSDVDGMIAFYQTPAGQHVLAAQPEIMKEYMPMVMKQVQERLLALTDSMRKDIKEQLASPAPPTATPKQR
jgi:hypothetical protein